MATIKTTVGHLVFLIHDFENNKEVYKKLFGYLDYNVIVDEPYGLGVMAPNGLSL